MFSEWPLRSGTACPTFTVLDYYATSPCRAPDSRPYPILALCIPGILDVSQALEPQAPKRSVNLFILDAPWHPAIIYNILPWEPSRKVPRTGVPKLWNMSLSWVASCLWYVKKTSAKILRRRKFPHPDISLGNIAKFLIVFSASSRITFHHFSSYPLGF